MIYDPFPAGKFCKKCNIWKPLIAYSIRKANKDGYFSACRFCRSEAYKSKKIEINKIRREKYAKNSEHRRNESARYRKANLDKSRESSRKSHHKHKEQRNEISRKYRIDHYSEIIQSQHEWYERNREYVRQYNKTHTEQDKARKLKREARKRNLPYIFSVKDWRRALDYFNNCCAVCGRPRGFWHTIAADHWIPLTDPRPDNPGTVVTNIVPLCHGQRGCNTEKQATDPAKWLTRKFGAIQAKKILDRINAYFEWVRQQDTHL